MQFPETELILTPENRVYHLNLKNEDIADDVIVVGDQFRVAQISSYFTSIEFKTQHREFITHTGIYNGKRLTVLSTGIGTDNIDIVLNELDAAVNINPVTRTLNTQHRTLNIIRLGTSGALQADIPVNGLVVSSHGLGLDGLLNFYEAWQTINENNISEKFISHTNWLNNLPYPYCVKASNNLLNKFSAGNFAGITATAPGFYGPQGRQIRLKAAMPNLNELLTSFNENNLRITNFEMETSALYGLGKLLGHDCVTICVIIANRVRKEFTSDYKKSVEVLIESCLNRLSEKENLASA
jgi:uridine phosphorylase